MIPSLFGNYLYIFGAICIRLFIFDELLEEKE